MNTHSLILSPLLCLLSAGLFCHSVLRQNCQVLERKYFAQYMDLKFHRCGEFEQIDFSVAVHCDGVVNLHAALKEAPLETDWLCLTSYGGATMETGAFSRFTNLNALYIVTRNVDLQPGTFSGLSQLTTLWIKVEYTDYDITFHKDTFDGLHSLKELKISDIPFSAFNFSLFNHLHLLDHLLLEQNNISYLSEVTASLGTFQNLKKLSLISSGISKLRTADCLTSRDALGPRHFVDFNISQLDLSKNNIDNAEPMSLCNFPHLEIFNMNIPSFDIEILYESGIETIKTISIQQAGVEVFEICACAKHFKAEELLLMYSSIYKLNTLKGSCKHLKKLNLAGNDLDKIEVKQMEKLYNLLELDLSNNLIESLKICKNESEPAMKLVDLNVSSNYLLRLHKGQFACLKELESLSLENNKINHIEDLAFDGLEQLRVLNLQYNNLFKIGELTFSNLFLVRHLNLYGNVLIEIDGQAFRHNFLQNISLTYDSMNDLYWWKFIGRSLRKISVKTNTLFLTSDVLDAFPFLESLTIDSPDNILNCGPFSAAKELQLKNTKLFDNIDAPWSPLATFTELERLYYSGDPQDVYNVSGFINSLKDVPSLRFLYLQDTDKMVKYNQMNVNTIFQGLSQLTVLHLKNSGIDRLDSKDIFSDLKSLEFLVIENQNMQEVEPVVFGSMPNLRYVYFLQTTFPCSCKFKGLLLWLESNTRVSIIDFHHQDCLVNHISINLIWFLDNDCRSNLDFIMFVLSFMFTLLFMSVSFFHESLWWHVLYIVYTVKCWLNHRLQRDETYDYDVFVSYNTNNETWVTEQFLPNLEQNGPPFFKVCIHNRDFEIGRYIVENIMDSIYKSRWTVCIISRSYLQSNWCSLEMRMATYRLLLESKDSLILIFLDKISREELQCYHRLTKLLHKKTHLEWPNDEKGQQLFWARLRKVITESGRKLK